MTEIKKRNEYGDFEELLRAHFYALDSTGQHYGLFFFFLEPQKGYTNRNPQGIETH